MSAADGPGVTVPRAGKYALGDYFGPGHHELINAIPHAAAMGMKVFDVGACFAILELPYRENLVGDPTRGVVFGGVITTLLDQALGLAVSCSLEDLRPIATLDLRIDYLRPATPHRPLFARAECYKVTKAVAFARGLGYETSESDPFATCLATFMIGSSMDDSPFANALEEYVAKSPR